MILWSCRTWDGDFAPNDERFTVEVVGERAAGAPLTLRVTDAAGVPVVGAEVEIVAGVTGEDGTLAVDAPADAAKVPGRGSHRERLW